MPHNAAGSRLVEEVCFGLGVRERCEGWRALALVAVGFNSRLGDDNSLWAI